MVCYVPSKTLKIDRLLFLYTFSQTLEVFVWAVAGKTGTGEGGGGSRRGGSVTTTKAWSEFSPDQTKWSRPEYDVEFEVPAGGRGGGREGEGGKGRGGRGRVEGLVISNIRTGLTHFWLVPDFGVLVVCLFRRFGVLSACPFRGHRYRFAHFPFSYVRLSLSFVLVPHIFPFLSHSHLYIALQLLPCALSSFICLVPSFSFIHPVVF